MKKSIRTAIAFAHVTGQLPIGIQASTYCRALEHLCDSYPKSVLPEFLHEIENHPFLIGDKFLREKGFSPSGNSRKNSRTIRYRDELESEAYVMRDGGGWIWWRRRSGLTFTNVTEEFQTPQPEKTK